MRPLFAAVFLLMAAVGLSISPTTAPTVADDNAAIRKVWDEAGVAVCEADWSRYERVWAHTPEIELIHPGQGEWLVGWDDIERKYKELLAQGLRCEFVTRTFRIHVAPSGEMAWGTVEAALRLPNQPEVTLWETVVFEKISGRWRFVHGHASSPSAPPAKPE